MTIIDKIIRKQKARQFADPITIVCLGDSVTEGCFECYINNEGNIATVFERNYSYSVKLQQMLARLYPTVQFNVINSGFSGGCAENGLQTLERDVLKFSPDLVIVSYGLNDSGRTISEYIKNLSAIFEKIKATGSEIIFLTQNSLCTNVSPHLTEKSLRDLASELSQRQNNGVLKRYFEEAKALCKEYDVEVCDLYSVWDAMAKADINITELLSNKLNHPIREYHSYIAIKLIEKMLGL